ncbi:hypothetical protein AUTU_11570 [Aureibacter tunicatorum]|nr:hypothetical protein AUTU_11570 [Aureibacter tunicatorum]
MEKNLLNALPYIIDEEIIVLDKDVNKEGLVLEEEAGEYSSAASSQHESEYLILHDEHGNSDMETFLEKIIASRSIDLKHCSVLDQFPDGVEFKTIISFGIHVPGSDIQSYQVSEGSGAEEILMADKLSLISKDVSLKKKLWSCLKELKF